MASDATNEQRLKLLELEVQRLLGLVYALVVATGVVLVILVLVLILVA